MDHDRDVIRVVEGRRAAIDVASSSPTWAKRSANELRKVVPVLVVAGAVRALGEIILVPPSSSAFGGSGILLASWLPIR